MATLNEYLQSIAQIAVNAQDYDTTDADERDELLGDLEDIEHDLRGARAAIEAQRVACAPRGTARRRVRR